jgi:sugar O-acyltransferase (sialic acid O-acetyltransferase NeuD family)
VSAPLLVLGAGGHGRVVADAAVSAGRRVLAFADEAPRAESYGGIPVRKAPASAVPRLAAELGAEVVVAVGSNWARQRLQLELGRANVPLATIVHPSSVVAASARLAAGVVVLAGVVVGVDVQLLEGCIVNTGARVDHDGIIGAFSHLSPGATLGGEVSVGEGTHLAVGVSVRNRVRIGSWCMVGVGAAVVKDLPDGVLALGVPARPVAPWEPR